METKHDFKVYLQKKTGKAIEITELLNGITWSGDYQQVSRKLDIEILKAINDKNQPVVVPEAGDIVSMTYNGAEVFTGVVWSRDLSSKSQFSKITCMDYLIYINKSSVSYNFKDVTAESITSQVCSGLNIPVGSLAATGVAINLPAIHKNAYDVIMAAYTKAAETTGKVYMPIYTSSGVSVIEKGSTQVSVKLDYETNTEGTQFTETLDSMVSRVIVCDEEGNIISTVEDSGWISTYGIIQDAIGVEKDKDMNVVAKNMLKPIEQKANVDALGCIEAITGSAIIVSDKHTGLDGLFYIDGDSHTFINNVYEMKLTLAFKNIMDKKTMENNSSSSSSSSSSENSSSETNEDGTPKTKVDTSWLDNWTVDAKGNPVMPKK